MRSHVYTGDDKDIPKELYLSDMFITPDKTFSELKVKLVTDGKEKNILYQYIRFVKLFDIESFVSFGGLV